MKLETVEDYLEVLGGLQGNHKIKIQSEDCTILYSIARQVFRGKAFTDRQLDVVLLKLNFYRSQFIDAGFTNLQEVIKMKTTRTPLRVVDRSQSIKIVDAPVRKAPIFSTRRFKQIPEKESSQKNSYVAIRFPFSKRAIQTVEQLAFSHRAGYYHEKGSHTHYFKIDELAVYDIVSAYKNKNYEIDQELLDYAHEVEKISNNPHGYVPGVYHLELKNTSKTLDDKITNHLGNLDVNNIHLYKDRAMLYGLDYFTDIHSYVNRTSVLTQRIINRTSPQIFISQVEWSLDAVVSSLVELKRFPLLVIIPENNPLDYISKMYESLKGFISPTDMTTMFRLDNKDDKEFNQYIKDKKLNNPLDKNTKVVYISSNKKYPKPLFVSDFKEETVLYLESVRNGRLDSYFEGDLIIHFDEVESQFGTYTTKNGNIQKI